MIQIWKYGKWLEWWEGEHEKCYATDTKKEKFDNDAIPQHAEHVDKIGDEDSYEYNKL